MELLQPNASPLKVYRQAKRILKSTSRASNPDWYRPAGQLQLQWHISIGSQSIVSAIHNRQQNQWWEGPQLPQISFETDDHGDPVAVDENSRKALHEILKKLLSSKEYGCKPKSLGIVLHLADTMRVRDLDPEFGADDDFDSLNELLITAPEVALGDDSVKSDDGDWRLFPFLGAGDEDKKSMAVQVSSRYEPIVREFREYGEMRNVPIIAETHSAALEAVAGLPEFVEDDKEFVNVLALIQFEAFTLLCSTGKRGEPTLLRPLFHRSGNHLAPSEIADVISNTGALLNLKDPRLFFVSTVGTPQSELTESLSAYLEANPGAEHACIDATSSPLVENIPACRMEMAVSVMPPSKSTGKALPLVQLRDEWAVQDFYGQSQAEKLLMPSRGDLQILKFAGLGQKLALVVVLGFAGWTGMDFFTKMRSEAWKLPPTAAQTMETRLVELKKERREWEHWANLLAKRSEGWLAMQALLDLFPDDGGVILSSAAYRANARRPDSDSETIGLEHTWVVSGYANPEVATQLATLGSRSRVAGLLNQIAEENHTDYLKVGTPTRDLSVSLQQRQGSMPPTLEFPTKVARHFRTAFELTISQSIESDDELALNTEPLE